MPRPPRPRVFDPTALNQMLNDDTMPLSQKYQYISDVRTGSDEDSARVDMTLVNMIIRIRGRLFEVHKLHNQFEEVYKEL